MVNWNLLFMSGNEKNEMNETNGFTVFFLENGPFILLKIFKHYNGYLHN